MVTIWIVIYLIGCLLSFWMLKVEYQAEGEVYTNGARALTLILSLLSFLMVLITLISAWIGKIAKTDYWKRPVKPEAESK